VTLVQRLTQITETKRSLNTEIDLYYPEGVPRIGSFVVIMDSFLPHPKVYCAALSHQATKHGIDALTVKTKPSVRIS